MDNAIKIDQNVQDERRGRIISGIVHAIMLLLFIMPLMNYPDPPPGQQGVLVSFGMPDMGSGDDMPDTQQEEKVNPTPPSEVAPPEVEPVKEKPKETPKPKPAETTKVKTQNNAETIRINQEKAAETRRRELEAQRQREVEAQQRAEEAAKRKAEAEAKAKADAEKKQYEDAKKQYGGLFGGGKGNTDDPGNQGDPNGNPNSDVLSGISTGAGTIGGGLENRGGAGPAIEDRSQEQGKVVIRICVNSSGKVISADYTQRGSTTQSRTLIALAKKNAMQYTFNSGSTDKQCGTIAYNFRVQ